jgi:RNA polymerase sigma-70 factor (ECF subfamily)
MSPESPDMVVQFPVISDGRLIAATLLAVAPVDPLRKLLDAAVEGNDRALSELVRLTQADVWKLCTALGSQGETEDLVQETYLRALKSLHSFRGDSSVRTWLLSVSRNVCADHVRRRERQRRLIDRVTPLAADAVTPGPVFIDEMIDGLSRDRRDAFVLTQMIGLSYEEAAQALGVPIGTVRSRVARARIELAALVRRAEAN